ncbi:hypothetical protein [Thaumasiovibrio sp. DFM-14]|uniref:hypothetical protein n=1 Tax=Thaumasiovibrio sp. DFM-14 TaxID=3384792 RepID=UPI00399FD0CC
MKRRDRFNGHDRLNSVVREDWIKAIAASPESWDALLYLPESKGDEPDKEPQESMYEDDIFGQADNHQDNLSYQVPFPVPVVDCPDEGGDGFMAVVAGGEALGEGEQPLLMRVGHADVPQGSVIEWNEKLASGESRRVWWYVHRSVVFGTTAVGALHYCIPCRSFDEETGIELYDEPLDSPEFI